MIPQLLILFFMTIGLTTNILKHGEKKNQEYNGWAYLIGAAINILILYYGGFWAVMG